MSTEKVSREKVKKNWMKKLFSRFVSDLPTYETYIKERFLDG